MCSVVKREFCVKNLWLNYEHPVHFHTPQWRWPFPVYIVYRFIMTVYTIFSFVETMVDLDPRPPDSPVTSETRTRPPAMAYLTIWTYLMLAIHFTWTFLITVVCYKKLLISPRTEPQLTSIKSCTPYKNAAFTEEHGRVKENSKSIQLDNNENDIDKIKNDIENNQNRNADTTPLVTLPWYSKISWVIANIVSVLSIIVTAIFFGALYKPSGSITMTDVNVHALNSVIILLDNFISARPVRLLHVIYPIIYGSIYVTWSAIYWAVDHENVLYKGILDWNVPGTTVGVVCGILALIALLQGLTFALYRLRLFIHRKCCCT